MKNYLITGGAGFFGGILAQEITARGDTCVLVDLLPADKNIPCKRSVVADISDEKRMRELFEQEHFDGVFHVAAILAHDKAQRNILWRSNVDATILLKQLCIKYQVPQLVFLSSNCLWAKNFDYPVSESEPPAPIERYGASKLAAEAVLLEDTSALHSVIIRCPTIIDEGRLGLLTILFDFIREHRRVWLVGKGDNRYQFIYAKDLADACLRAIAYPKSDIFHIGSDQVTSLRETFDYVIKQSGSRSKTTPLPKAPLLFGMRLAHWLGISPLGPYHYRMIANNFVFDTSHLKQSLGWQPTLTNAEMLYKAYHYYQENRQSIQGANQSSIHKRGSKLGIIRLLKWLS